MLERVCYPKIGVQNFTFGQSASSNKSRNTELGLAAIALSLSALTGCTIDESPLYDTFEPSEEVSSTRLNNDENQINLSVYDKTSKILKTLGILQGENDSIDKVKTICCRDENGTQYWTKFNDIQENVISGKAMTILPNDSPDEIYNYKIVNNGENSVNVKKIYDNGDVETDNYEILDDGSVVKSDVLDNGFCLETSEYRKSGDGKIEQSLPDGTNKVFSVELNNPYPTPIVFGSPTVVGYNEVTCQN